MGQFAQEQQRIGWQSKKKRQKSRQLQDLDRRKRHLVVKTWKASVHQYVSEQEEE